MRINGHVLQNVGVIGTIQYVQLAIVVCPWLRVGIFDFYFKVGGMSKPVISPVADLSAC